ncbi:MAG TPA: hypothetical protein VGX49_01070 [Jatrophihabitans sp.]|jgi:hypothetical protein|nr:hypothetical protein [Jatrophihabitans sp.]
MKARNRRAAPVEDRQVAEMIADPAEYFSKVRETSRREARTYVANRELAGRRTRQTAKPA